MRAILLVPFDDRLPLDFYSDASHVNSFSHHDLSVQSPVYPACGIYLQQCVSSFHERDFHRRAYPVLLYERSIQYVIIRRTKEDIWNRHRKHYSGLLSLTSFNSTKLVHERTGDSVRESSENLGIKVIPRRARPPKFQGDALGDCKGSLAARLVVREACYSPAVGITTDAHDSDRSDCRSWSPATSTQSGPMV